MTSFDIGSTGPAFFIFANLNGTISAWNVANVKWPDAQRRDCRGRDACNGRPLHRSGHEQRWRHALCRQWKRPAKSKSSTAHSLRRLSPADLSIPTIPSGFVPFNVEDIGGKVYVTYAPAGRDAQTARRRAWEWSPFLVRTGLATEPCDAAAHSPRLGAWPLRQLVSARSAATCWSAISASATAKSTPSMRRQGTFEGTIDVNPGAGNTAGGLWDLIFGSGGRPATRDPLHHRRHQRRERRPVRGDNRSRAIDLGDDADRIWRTRAVRRAAARVPGHRLRGKAGKRTARNRTVLFPRPIAAVSRDGAEASRRQNFGAVFGRQHREQLPLLGLCVGAQLAEPAPCGCRQGSRRP